MNYARDILIANLEGGGAWLFQYFPDGIDTEDRVNWTPQNVSIGTKPLTYANREPQQIELPEVWLDTSDTNESLHEQIEAIRLLMAETRRGMPPPLLFVCGDWQVRVVMTNLKVSRKLYTKNGGRPIRAQLSISLLELQEDSGHATVTIRDDITVNESSVTGSQRRVFGPEF